MASLHRDVTDISKSIKERNISIIIDASGSMYKTFGIIKEAAMMLIHNTLYRQEHGSFNVISFSNSSQVFSNSMVSCSKENLALAATWIHGLTCEASTNTLSALVTAYSDDNSDAIVIFTDGLPNQKPSVVLKCITELSQGRPIHSIYVNNGNIDDSVVQFWEKLALNTNGSLHLLTSGSHNKCKSQQIYPFRKTYRGDSSGSDSSSDSSSASDYSSESESDTERTDLDHGNNYLGKVVLAKRKSSGYYYKGTIVKLMLSIEQVVVLFQSSKDIKFQLQQKCPLNDIVFYDEAKQHRIYSGDKVLVNLSSKKKKFTPATVLKKEYLFDDDDTGFDKLLEVELFNGEIKRVPLAAAVHISLDVYKKIVRGIDEKVTSSSRKKKQRKRHSRKCSHKEEDEDGTDDEKHDRNARNYLKEKIDRQLKESEELLASLNMKEQEEFLYQQKLLAMAQEEKRGDYIYENGFTDGYESAVETYDKVKKIRQRTASREKLLASIPSSFEDGVIGRHVRSRSAEPKELRESYFEPHPPSWKTNKKRLENTPRRRYRSATVGSNVVERSKKHWVGRPITRETAPYTGRYKSKQSVPTAEEYQTADGVPFPVKTDRRLIQQRSSNWTPGRSDNSGYKHHDIIAHRVVDKFPKKTNNSHSPVNASYKDKDRIEVLKTKRELRDLKEQIARQDRSVQFGEREEQPRYHHNGQEGKGYTKVKITIEKDASKAKIKQRKQEEQRKYETQRELKNQQKKYERIDALKDRRKVYDDMKRKRAQEQWVDKGERVNARSQEERKNDFEQRRVDKQIEDHESKIRRLKQIRKYTDARFRHMRKDNDRHRDINEHVKDVNQGHYRASILP